MGSFVYPTNAELTEVLQEKMPVRMAEDAVFGIMPIEEDDASLVMWEQEDNYVGLMNLRGFEGRPGNVRQVGMKQYQMTPGVYGDYISLSETELTLGRATGSMGQPIDIQKLILKRQDQLLNRAIDRLRQVAWSLISKGEFKVFAADGKLEHSDSYAIQNFDAEHGWSESGAATPLADLRQVKMKARGKGVQFGNSAVAYMNQVTFNSLLSNANSSDFAGRRLGGIYPPLSFEDVNRLMLGEDLPQIQIYDEGYLDEAGAFQAFLEDGKVVVVGKRPAGQQVAGFKLTRNASNSDAGPGMYTKVIDRGEDAVPRTIEVHMGFNGGPAIYYPSAIVSLNVA